MHIEPMDDWASPSLNSLIAVCFSPLALLLIFLCAKRGEIRLTFPRPKQHFIFSRNQPRELGQLFFIPTVSAHHRMLKVVELNNRDRWVSCKRAHTCTHTYVSAYILANRYTQQQLEWLWKSFQRRPDCFITMACGKCLTPKLDYINKLSHIFS